MTESKRIKAVWRLKEDIAQVKTLKTNVEMKRKKDQSTLTTVRKKHKALSFIVKLMCGLKTWRRN